MQDSSGATGEDRRIVRRRTAAKPAGPWPGAAPGGQGSVARLPSWWSPVGPRRPVEAPRRLRDLSRPGRLLAVALVALLCLPFVVALVRLDREGWTIHSDDALLGVRTLDVLDGSPPLTGQPSTSETAGGGIRTYHPGPIEMWAFSPLVALLGQWGMPVGAALVNLAATLTVVWVAFRRTGPAGGVVAGVLAALWVHSVGTALLVDPVSSNLWGMGVMALAVCAWGVVDGDHRLLVLTAWWASWVGQQHLSAVVPAAVLVLVALVGVAVTWHRSEPGSRRGVLGWLAAAGAVGLVLWSPVGVQQLTGDQGNITAVVEYAGVEGRTTYGLGGAVDIAAGALAPPVILRTDVTGIDLAGDPGVGGRLVAAAIVALALAVVAGSGLERRARTLVLVGLALAPAGIFNASNIPGNTVEVLRVNLHRWVWPFTTLVVVGSAWAVADLLRRRAAADPVRQARTEAAGRLASDHGALAGVVLAAALVVATLVPTGVDDEPDDLWSPSLAAAAAEAVRTDAGDAEEVLLVPFGAAAELSVVPALTFALEREGVSVEVPERLEPYFGDRGTDGSWDAAYVVAGTGYGPGMVPPPVAGRVVADVIVDGRLAATTERLATQLRGTEPTLGPAGIAAISELAPTDQLAVRSAVAGLATDPVAGLIDPVVAPLLRDGIEGVELDPGTVERHLALVEEGRRVWGSRRLVVLRLESGEAEALLAETGGLR